MQIFSSYRKGSKKQFMLFLRFCCSKAPSHVFQSATNEMVVIFRGFGDAGNGFQAKVWSNVDDETVVR